MTTNTNEIKIVKVDKENVAEYGFYCIKDKKSAAYKAKLHWFTSAENTDIGIFIALDSNQNQLGFIEFSSSEKSWRPVIAENYLFINCIVVISKESRNKGIASLLINACEQEAVLQHKDGIFTFCSEGVWLAGASLFLKNGFYSLGKKDRFDLMVKKMNPNASDPKFADWSKNLDEYTGWNLVFSNQCPWHIKSVTDLQQAAAEKGIELKITQINSSVDVLKSPSGYGTFSLVKDGKLLEDHYLSKTRFLNILNKELK